MRIRRKPRPCPPETPVENLIAGSLLLLSVEDRIEDLILDLHNAVACLEASGLPSGPSKFRAQQLIGALRVVQAL
jgi:hypothetical protein